MDKTSIELKVITKNGIMYDGSIQSITLPSINGQITILPNHIPLLSGLRDGIILIDGNAEKSICINSGFVRFVNNACVLTIEEAVVQKAS